MIDILNKLDSWVFNLCGWIMLILTWLSIGDESCIWAVGGITCFGIQIIIGKLDDLNKN